jgi:hypothetical protein
MCSLKLTKWLYLLLSTKIALVLIRETSRILVYVLESFTFSVWHHPNLGIKSVT